MLLLASAQTTQVSPAISQARLLSIPVEEPSRAHCLQTQLFPTLFILKTIAFLSLLHSYLEAMRDGDGTNSRILFGFASSLGFP